MKCTFLEAEQARNFSHSCGVQKASCIYCKNISRVAVDLQRREMYRPCFSDLAQIWQVSGGSWWHARLQRVATIGEANFVIHVSQSDVFNWQGLICLSLGTCNFAMTHTTQYTSDSVLWRCTK
jgi:hypothetical protein